MVISAHVCRTHTFVCRAQREKERAEEGGREIESERESERVSATKGRVMISRERIIARELPSLPKKLHSFANSNPMLTLARVRPNIRSPVRCVARD